VFAGLEPAVEVVRGDVDAVTQHLVTERDAQRDHHAPAFSSWTRRSQGRHPYRSAHSGSHGAAAAGTHQLRHRPPALDDSQREHDRRDGRWTHVEQGAYAELRGRRGFYDRLYTSQFTEPLAEAAIIRSALCCRRDL
jgi:hypothetical protein